MILKLYSNVVSLSFHDFVAGHFHYYYLLTTSFTINSMPYLCSCSLIIHRQDKSDPHDRADPKRFFTPSKVYHEGVCDQEEISTIHAKVAFTKSTILS